METAVVGGEPDRVPNVLLVGTYPIHKAGITMAESMIDHERACQAMLSFYETYSYLDIMAPGGGYLFTTGYSLEDCPQENMVTLLEAVDKYGRY